MENSAHETQTKSSRAFPFGWLFTWRIARRMLVGLAGFATMIAIFYTVENWRGKRAWENYKREAEAKGAVLDWNAFIPPPVPDEQNVFKAPKMQEWFVGRGANELSKRLGLKRNSNVGARTIAEIIFGQSKPDDATGTLHFDDPSAPKQIEQFVQSILGPSAKGSQNIALLARPLNETNTVRIFVPSDKIPTSQEMTKLLASFESGASQLRIESATSNSFHLTVNPSVYTAADYLAWSDSFDSDFNLIREALKRPYARMDGDYRQPLEIPIPNFICVRNTAQTLAQRAQCFLLLDQPEKALRELTLLHDLSRLLEAKPTSRPMTLVAAMINVAITGLYAEVIADGMRLRAWREPQLAALQEQLQEINLLPFVEGGFICERVASCHTLETVELRKILALDSDSSDPTSLWQEIKNLRHIYYDLVPRGWIYQNMVVHGKLLGKTIDGFDSANQLIPPRKQIEATLAVEAVMAHKSPYNFITFITVPNFSRATQRLGQNQTKASQAAIVCALERYRLVHRNFPETLDALIPQFMEKIPHDIINGKPLNYRRTDDGQFILYSVGWNETDDGGVFIEGKTKGVDSGEGDWVWQNSSK